jgi:hypothetical protein
MCTDDLGDVLCGETNVLPDSAKGDGVLAGAFVKPALWQFQSIGGLLDGEKALLTGFLSHLFLSHFDTG